MDAALAPSTNTAVSNAPGIQAPEQRDSFPLVENGISSAPQDRVSLQRAVAAERSERRTSSSPESEPSQARDSVAQPPVSEEQRFVQMQIQQRALQEKIDQQQALINGTNSNIASSRQDASTGGATGFFMWASGTKSAMNQDISSMQELNDKRTLQLEEMKTTLERQQRASENFLKQEHKGRELQAQGDFAGAQNAFNAAQSSFAGSMNAEQPRLVVETATYRAQQAQLNSDLKDSVAALDTTESVMRTTQKVAIVAGATVATGGAALAVGGVTGAVVGVAAGTAYGTAVGGTAAVTEAVGHVARGNKTADKAFNDAGQQTLEAAQESAIASVGTVLGMGAGGRVATAIGSRLGSSAAATVTTGIATGATAGATNAAFSTTVHIGMEYKSAVSEFSRENSGANLTPAERQARFDQFMQDKNLSATQIAQRVGHDVALGTLGGAVGGGAGAGKELLGKSRVYAIASEGGQLVADAGIGITDAALNGNLNSQGITESIAGAVVGNVAGRISQHASQKKQGHSNVDPTPPRPDGINDSPVSYRIDDYRIPVTTSPQANPEILQFSDYQQLPQELRMAAGAESLGSKTRSPKTSSSPAQENAPETIRINRDTERTPTHETAHTPEPTPVKPPTSNHNPDIGMPRHEDIQRFFDSEKVRTGSYGDPNLDSFTSREVADYAHAQLSSLGELAPEAMILLRSEKRMGTQIDGVPLGRLLENPEMIRDAIYEARKIYTDNTNGPINRIPSSFPETHAAIEKFNNIKSAIEQDFSISDISISERRGRFTGLVLDTNSPGVNVRYDNAHTLDSGVPLSPARARAAHGPGGDLSHIDVTITETKATYRYFQGEDNHIYMYDPKNKQLYQQVEIQENLEWKPVPLNHNYGSGD